MRVRPSTGAERYSLRRRLLSGLLAFVLLAITPAPGTWTAAQSVDVEWDRFYDGPGSRGDEARAIAIDDSGNVYVTGRSEQSPGGGNDDMATLKYTAGGVLEWAERFDGVGSAADEAHDLALDTDGNIYVTGYATQLSEDYTTIKYTPQGDTLWVRHFDGNGSNDHGMAIVVDRAGNVCVTGRSWNGAAQFDIATVKYRPNGDTAWVRRYAGTANSADVARDIAVDTLGNVYVTGYAEMVGSYNDIVTIKYDSAGSTEWIRHYNHSADTSDIPQSLVVDVSGHVYVTGTSFDHSTGNDFVTIKYDANGDTAWIARYSGRSDFAADFAYDLAVDDLGNVFVTGGSTKESNRFDVTTVKYNVSGDTVWTRRHTGTGATLNYGNALAVDTWGNPYVTGMLEQGGLFETDMVTIRYTADGEVVWLTEYDGADHDMDVANDIALDQAGNVYVAGSVRDSVTFSDYAVLKYYQHYPPVPHDLEFILFSPVHMVVTDPRMDSIGIGFNTIQDGSAYDEVTDYNNDGEPDDIVTIPSPVEGDYNVRIIRDLGVGDSAKFTLGIRIDGNQLLIPEDYQDQYVSALGTTVPDTYYWTAETTLCGDCNADGTTNAADIIYLVNYVFKTGPEPEVPQHGDVNCDGVLTAADIVYLVNFVFKSGVSPCSQTGE